MTVSSGIHVCCRLSTEGHVSAWGVAEEEIVCHWSPASVWINGKRDHDYHCLYKLSNNVVTINNFQCGGIHTIASHQFLTFFGLQMLFGSGRDGFTYINRFREVRSGRGRSNGDISTHNRVRAGWGRKRRWARVRVEGNVQREGGAVTD